MTMAELRATMARHKGHALGIALSLVVLIASLAFGLNARRRLAPARLAESRLEQAASEITSFRAAFKPSTPEQEARLLLPDSLAVAVPHDMRMSLAGQLATRAERAGLIGVRVRFAAADSAVAPTRPDFVDKAVSIGDYTIALDCGGSFAAVMSLVNHLPASTPLQRLTAARTTTGVTYHLVFAVLETGGSSGAGGGAQHG